MEAFILALITEFAGKYPVIASIVLIIGVARVMFKPLSTLIQLFVDTTPSPKDNELWERFKGSGLYKGIAFVVDYLLSIKLPGEK